MTGRATPRPRPLIDPWRDAFVVRLRLKDVRGTSIGDALAEVDAHCTDTGETPDLAFGDPVAYAEAVRQSLPASVLVPRTPWWTTTLQAVATLLGVSFLLSGIDAVAHGTPGQVGWGSLLAVALVAVMINVVVLALDTLSGPGSSWRLYLALVLGFAVAVAPPVLWPAVAFHAPGWALLTGGVVALGVWLPRSAGGLAARDGFRDLVTDPVSGEQPFRTPRLVLALAWLLPATLLLAAIAIVAIPA